MQIHYARERVDAIIDVASRFARMHRVLGKNGVAWWALFRDFLTRHASTVVNLPTIT
jgi:hypothetical protein